MEQEKIKRQKIRRFIDGLYSKSEVSDLLKSIHDTDMQQAIDDVSEQLWNESIEKKLLCVIWSVKNTKKRQLGC